MDLLHAGRQASCEFKTDWPLALIVFTGELTLDFVMQCVEQKLAIDEIQKARLFLLDFREAEIKLTRQELRIVADRIKEDLPSTVFLAFLVNKPLETAMVYLFSQHLSSFHDVNVYNSPDAAFAAFCSRTNINYFQSEIYETVRREDY